MTNKATGDSFKSLVFLFSLPFEAFQAKQSGPWVLCTLYTEYTRPCTLCTLDPVQCTLYTRPGILYSVSCIKIFSFGLLSLKLYSVQGVPGRIQSNLVFSGIQGVPGKRKPVSPGVFFGSHWTMRASSNTRKFSWALCNSRSEGGYVWRFIEYKCTHMKLYQQTTVHVLKCTTVQVYKCTRQKCTNVL